MAIDRKLGSNKKTITIEIISLLIIKIEIFKNRAMFNSIIIENLISLVLNI
jgi:hypothetical protein